MEIPKDSNVNKCVWCLNDGRRRCSRCQSVYYCSREHQVEHWPVHKHECRRPTLQTVQNAQQVPLNVAAGNNSADPMVTNSFQAAQQVSDFNSWCQNNSAAAMNTSESISFPSMDERILSSLNSEFLSSDNFWNIINSCSPNLYNSSMVANNAQISASIQEPQNSNVEPEKDGIVLRVPLESICETIVKDMNDYGICVLDNFLGNKLGLSVVEDVTSLYQKGIFKKGQLVAENPQREKEIVRNDVTTWVNGLEPGCSNIGNLIKKLDEIVNGCNKFPDNGQLSKYKLHRRTKAMVACYPGDGTHYKKHIDNPYKDGRCITCIYYLNQNWDLKSQGGLLRMFPTSHATQVVDIEPIFDRMIFFWSDKRNPHEVKPAYATRFAITVWYFDADERDQALLALKSKQTM